MQIEVRSQASGLVLAGSGFQQAAGQRHARESVRSYRPQAQNLQSKCSYQTPHRSLVHVLQRHYQVEHRADRRWGEKRRMWFKNNQPDIMYLEGVFSSSEGASGKCVTNYDTQGRFERSRCTAGRRLRCWTRVHRQARYEYRANVISDKLYFPLVMRDSRTCNLSARRQGNVW